MMKFTRTGKAALAFALACTFAATSVWALVNPNFTPIHMVEQSETIVQLKFEGVDDENIVTATVVKVIKGDYADEQVRIDPMAAIAPGQSEAFLDAIRAGQEYGVLFVGEFEPGEFEGGMAGEAMGDMGGDGPQAQGFLHIDGLPGTQWLVMEMWDDGLWEMIQPDALLLATYNGGTDMLLRMIDYILADPEADVPIGSGVDWQDDSLALGTIDGEVVSATAVFLSDDPAAVASDLFLASPAGDRVYRWTGDTMEDVTDELGLASASSLHAWGDFNADGRLDLASFDGETLTLHVRSENATFAAEAIELEDAGGWLSLDAIDGGGDGASLLAGTEASPMLLSFADGGVDAQPVVEEGSDVSFPDGAWGCVVADFDGDGLADVLQLGLGESLLYLGEGSGAFASPQQANAGVGDGGRGVTIGDFDHDGLPDLFVASQRRHLLWQNRGEGRFEETMMVSGEVSYKWTDNGVSAQAVDFNNDGREDLVVGYTGQRVPYILYNRGYRSFAHALELDLAEQNRVGDAASGQQAIVLEDFNGNGAKDLVMVLTGGELVMLPRAVEGPGALAVRAALPLGDASAGPVNVKAWRFERSLGMRVARQGGAGAFFGVRSPGPVRLEWQYPDGETRETELILEDGPVRILLEE